MTLTLKCNILFCFEIEYGDVYGSPPSRDISIMGIGALITQLCENEKVVRFFLLTLYIYIVYYIYIYIYTKSKLH